VLGFPGTVGTITRQMSTGDHVFAARAALADRAHRLRHELRHSYAGGHPPAGDVFNLDTHIAVIADVRTVLERRGLSLTSWSISGHTWVFDRERDAVGVVNERTWQAFRPELVHRFRRVYGSYLRRFRGYVATYPPCFALLYEGLPAPTLAVCATRYEWPFTHDAERWDWLDDALRAGVTTGWLTVVANNRADADYVANYTGVHPPHIPSACTYIPSAYSGRRRSVVVSTKRDVLAASICAELRQEAVPLRAGLGKRYRWRDLYDHRAIVVIPYNTSLMSLFEHYSACAPIYVPARPFLKELMKRYPAEVLSDLSFSQVTGTPASARPSATLDLNDIRDEEIVDWYLDRADFYDRTWMPAIREFESWGHLDHLIANDDHRAIADEMTAERPGRLARIASLWDDLAWTRAIAESGR
jgi:hypothetical protein